MRHLKSAIALGFLLLGAGCAAGPSAGERAGLEQGYQALEARQYEQAIARADAYLARTPHGAGSAEALYLKGRGYEGKIASNMNEARANLQSARTAYIEALQQKPRQPLEAHIRASLANVAYFQEDYATAQQQWSSAIGRLDSADARAWATYRVGVCEQRLGRFEQADRTFARVQQQFPGTVPAQRAKEHQGVRSFAVQVATYATPRGAQGGLDKLKRLGMSGTTALDQRGNTVVRLGPAASYAQATALRNRLAGAFPDAVIVP